MIKAKFFYSNNSCVGFCVSGHALFDEFGRDIVCAAVTSAVQLTVNGITELTAQTPKVEVLENSISLILNNSCDDISALNFLSALWLHLELISQDYKDTILLTKVEV